MQLCNLLDKKQAEPAYPLFSEMAFVDSRLIT